VLITVLGWHHTQGWLPADGINACRPDTTALLIDALLTFTAFNYRVKEWCSVCQQTQKKTGIS
jgi:hypothetical protein